MRVWLDERKGMEESMEIISFEKCHIPAAGLLVHKAYQSEREKVSCLRLIGCTDALSNLIAGLAGNGLGVAALEDGKLAGFLAGMAVGELFGSSRGIYVPLYAHGAAGLDRGRLYQRMYAAASDIWVEKGHLSHVITLHAHDSVAVDAWFWQDFGLRCVDSIRPLIDVLPQGAGVYDIRRIMPGEASTILESHKEHWRYYKNAPMFMLVHEDVSLNGLEDWLNEKDHYLWAAFENQMPVAYMQLRHGGETFVSDDEKSMNICGAYVKPGQRKSGYGTALLQTIVHWMRENSFERLGVDFESFNIEGSRFWQKYFTPFTYSLTRRIDERTYMPNDK